jgi:glycosyltransferase involved in cell wall biosynthesis
MSEKKILFVTHLFYPARGGVEAHLKRLSHGLSEIGFQVHVLTTNAYSTEGFFLNDKRRMESSHEILNNIEVERLGFKTFGRRTLNLLRNLACRIKYPFNNWIRTYSYGPRNPRFYRRILEIKPDLILAAPLPMFNIYYAWKGAKRLGIPLVINPAFHIHDPCSLVNPLFFRIMREAGLVAVHSDTEGDFIANAAGIPLEKIKVFPPLPFTKKDLDPPDHSLGRIEIKDHFGIEQKFVLLFLGQHGRHKNIREIIMAMPRIWEHRPDVALVIAGGSTAYTPELKRMKDNLDPGHRHKVYFFDNFPAEEKDQFYQMADVFISLSDFESFGIVLAEAMLHRIPVIASVCGIANSIVKDFHSGLLVNPYCEVEVAGAIMELLLDDDIRKIYGDNGRQTAISRYDPEVILQQWEKRLSALHYLRME